MIVNRKCSINGVMFDIICVNDDNGEMVTVLVVRLASSFSFM